jgi:hypothetical protein
LVDRRFSDYGYLRNRGSTTGFRAFTRRVQRFHLCRCVLFGASGEYEEAWSLGNMFSGRIQAALAYHAISDTAEVFARQVWLEALLARRLSASALRWPHAALGLLALIAGAVIAAVQGLSIGGDTASALGWLVFALGLTVTIAAGIGGFFQFADRRATAIWTSFELEQLGWEFLTASGTYAELLQVHRKKAGMPPLNWPGLPDDRLEEWHAEAFADFRLRVHALLEADVSGLVAGIRRTSQANGAPEYT